MSILRTHNLQNPDSSSINIVMDQGGNTNIAGVTTVGSNFYVPSGSVGIGSDNPGDKLSISGGNLGIYNTGNNHGNVYFYKNGTAKGWLKYRGNDDKLVIGNVTDAINVLTDGNIGVGYASPSQKLVVKGTTSLMATNSTNQWMAYTYTDDTFRLNYNGSGSDELTITSAGHVLHGVTADEDTSGNGGLRFINSGDIQIDGDQKALVFRSTSADAQTQSGIEWWNENGAGIQAKILVDRTAVSQAPSDLVFYTNANVDTSANNSEGDITERLRITSGGNVNIKGGNLSVGLDSATLDFTDSNSNTKFVEIGASGGDALLVTHSSGAGVGYFGYEAGGDRLVVACDNGSGSNKIDFIVNAGTTTGGGTDNLNNVSPALRIASDGKVGINFNTPAYMLEVHNPDPGNDSKQLIQRWVNTSQNTVELNMYGGSVDQCQFATTNSEQTLSFLTGVNSGNVNSTQTSLLLTQNRDAWFQGPNTSNYGGGLFIGAEASPYLSLCALRDSNRRPLIYMGGAYPEITLAHTVASNTNHGPTIRFATYVQSTNTPTGNQFVIGTNGSGTFLDIGHAAVAQNQNVHAGINSYAGTHRFRVTTSGCQVNGTFSVSSTKNFKIPHPLSTKTETHDLVHSSIEGPQADLIYRGVVDLVDGTATVNIDTAGRMTEGTFEVLCTNVSCFTSNETDWTAVKGSVSGNILTITAQDNTSTATVSWMVVGERKDQGMIDSPATDDNGRLITEPLKSS